MDLNKLIQGYDLAIVSLLGEDGFPVSFPVKDIRIDVDKILVDRPRGLHFNISEGQKSCILFHVFHIVNESWKDLRHVFFRGHFSRVCADFLEFKPKNFYSFRLDGFLNQLRFMLDGRKRTKKWLRERGV